MNTPVVQNSQLPAHLQHLVNDPRFAAPVSALSAGISQGGWPRISIKASRFRLQSPQGGEVVVADTFLDVVIVDANPSISKIYYKQAYDAKADDSSFKAPDCFSDNGVAPSSKAASPQCGTCQACPHNVWGSKIASNGAQTKACADAKKVAVLIANNPDGPVFELRVPPASLKNLGAYGESLSKRGIPDYAVVTRLSFDTNSDFPKLTFTASGWSSAEHAAALADIKGTEEVDQCTGKNDKPFNGNAAAIAAPLPPRAELPPVVQPLAQVQQAVQQQNIAAAQANFLDQAVQQPAAIAEKPKRTRRTKEQMVGNGFTPAPVVEDNTPLPPILQNRTPVQSASTPAHGAVLNPPTISDAALDSLIASAMKV